ncbi:MAG: hypothetical protein OEV60_07470 [Actinomycetota bacterium]|jgi:hypothetical protein|nr:hypothetical protein [Actinomycetota bacterium]MDH5242449.1 hypothetical protein [Chloroflexota bacterium]
MLDVAAVVFLVAACSRIPLPSPAYPAQPVLDACSKVLLPAVDATTFDPNAPNCVIVLWDQTMNGVVIEPRPPEPPQTRALPVELVESAHETGNEDSCNYETNYREGWLKHLPPVDVDLPHDKGWIATIWTRVAARPWADALCILIES